MRTKLFQGQTQNTNTNIVPSKRTCGHNPHMPPKMRSVACLQTRCLGPQRTAQCRLLWEHSAAQLAGLSPLASELLSWWAAPCRTRPNAESRPQKNLPAEQCEKVYTWCKVGPVVIPASSFRAKVSSALRRSCCNESATGGTAAAPMNAKRNRKTSNRQKKLGTKRFCVRIA